MNDQNEQIQLTVQAQRWKMAFLGLIILIAGIFIGSGLSSLFKYHRQKDQLSGVEFINERTMQHLQHELKLSPQQADKIKVICDKHLEALYEIREQARPRIAEQMNQLYADVRTILDEQQQELWSQSVQRLISRFAVPAHQRGPQGRQPNRRRLGPNGHFPPPHRPFGFWEDESGHRPPPLHEDGNIPPREQRPLR